MAEYIAHEGQSLRSHLEGVAAVCRRNAEKIGLGDCGELLGLLHDLGKYSEEFQNYIKSAVGILNPDEDAEFVDAGGLRGRIDHSTAGAQCLWKELCHGTQVQQIFAQIAALCLVSHHSGLIDSLKSGPNGTIDSFSLRLGKDQALTHTEESIVKSEVKQEVDRLLTKQELAGPLKEMIRAIVMAAPQRHHQAVVVQFQLGLLVRFLFSCLIDADRQDTADAEKPRAAGARQRGEYRGWDCLVERLDRALERFAGQQTTVNIARQQVSEYCLSAAARQRGVYTLTVPTGGGKTLASLRFALNHAREHGLDRVIYVIPFTSIIDQNAERTRQILEPRDTPFDKGRIVLEHHSNIGGDKQTWKEKLLTENWDAPVVYTTQVQFLEALFGGGTRGARRLHQLARSVIIFDEIQTIPIRCVHMFCNAVRFVVEQCGSTVLLCSATQPLLAEVDPLKGALPVRPDREIVPNVERLFKDLRRVKVIDSRKLGGWADSEIADLAISELNEAGSCLVIVNTKASARRLVTECRERVGANNVAAIYHLSTSMCPAHRKKVLRRIHRRLAVSFPTLCVSTQLIEAGVDVDFGSVIRFLAGLDSVAQAAGRCNRNGRRSAGRVHIVNPSSENIDCLTDIVVGKEKSERVLNDFADRPAEFDCDAIGPKLLEWYYRNYFFGRKGEMDYPLSEKVTGRADTLLNLLSANVFAVSDFGRRTGKELPTMLRQSFMTAGEAFRAIDAPTQSVIVPFGKEGKEVVGGLSSAFDVEKQFRLIRKAQQYSVNLFQHEFAALHNAIRPVQEGTNIFYLFDSRYYSESFGMAIEPAEQSSQEVLYV